MTTQSPRAALDRAVKFFETLTPELVNDLPRYYSDDAYFKDPFNEVHGATKIRAIFADMYGPLIDPRFVVRESLLEGDRALLVWDMTFRIRKYKPQITQKIRGVSHLYFAADGRINYHRDYWDTAEELYAKLPLIGGLMRFLARRLSHG
jgi:steroid delta-isomerase